MSSRSYRYVMPLGTALLAIVFFGGGAAFMFAMPWSGRHRLRVFGLALDPGTTAWVATITGILCAGFVVLALFSLLFLRGDEQNVIIDDEGVTIPRTAFSRRVTIPWRAITSVEERQVRKTRFLQIRHEGGKSSIGEKMIGEANYAEVAALIKQHT